MGEICPIKKQYLPPCDNWKENHSDCSDKHFAAYAGDYAKKGYKNGAQYDTEDDGENDDDFNE